MEHFSVKPEIYFKPDALDYLTTIHKQRALVITDPFIVKIGMCDKLLSKLEGSVSEWEVFSNIKPDPPIEVVAAGMQKMLDFNPDVIIALGGGSTIDAAKSILLFTNKIQNSAQNSENKKPQFIAIPTTSGTGSEVTNFSIITMGQVKVPIINDDMLPDVAIIDPVLVKTVPMRVTADTALDALTHAIEAYVSKSASDYSDALAEKTVKMIFDFLIKAYKNGSDTYTREKLHNASCMAGMAFTNASLGINHSLAHAAGGTFHIPHGRAIAILLPYVIEFNADLGSTNTSEAARKYAELAKIIGLPSKTVEEGVQNFIRAVTILMKETDTPLSFKEAGIQAYQFEEKIPAMSKTAIEDRCTVTNPREVNVEILSSLYRKAYGK